MHGFTSRLDEINALGESQKGFIWRLVEKEDDIPVNISVFKDRKLAVNMSVWESVADLKHFTYQTMHKELIRGKKAWFEQLESAAYVLWWVEVGKLPTIKEGKAKLELLTKNGPTAAAFDFKNVFEPE